MVKLIATKGGQTFTALFNSRGQAIGADTPTTASYQLQQGTAVTVTIRLRLTAGSTAATQAFEGALKLTFQLPEGMSAERQAAVLEAARKAAQEVEAALAKKPPLSAIPGLRGISPSLDKSEVAARLVAAVNSEGSTSQVENFRTAVTNLGVFDSLFKAVQAELLAVAAQKLEVRKDLSPIDGSEFPLDQVVITSSGLLGFSGQRAPINLGGAVSSNFVPTPARGGSGGGSAPVGPPPGSSRIVSLYTSGFNPYGLAYLQDRDIGGARLAFADNASGTLLTLSGASAEASGSFGIAGLAQNVSVAQARNASGTLYAGGVAAGIKFFEPDGEETGSLSSSGLPYALAADSVRIYYVDNGSGNTSYPVRWVDHADRTSSDVVRVGTDVWEFNDALSMAVFDPRVDGVATTSVGTSTIFVGTANAIFSAHDGASRTLATGLAPVYGLAFATPTLYAALIDYSIGGKVIALNVNDPSASSVVVSQAQATAVTGASVFFPWGVALDSTATPTYLYLSDFQSKQVLRVQLGDL